LLMLAAFAFMLPTMATAQEASKAINFQFTDIAGKTIRLSDFNGQWVMVNFWAPWCPLCWVEVPALNEMNKRADFVVIGIGLDYGPDEKIVSDAAKRHDMNFHAVVAGGARRNPDSPFRQVGPVDFYPTSYLYDPNGEIVMFIPGQVKTSKVLAFMDKWNAKNNKTQMATQEKPAAPMATAPGAAVQGVSYGAPAAAKPATPPATPPRNRNNSRTVTY
jgi:thiol-disulfide isomerase/thioredoxin